MTEVLHPRHVEGMVLQHSAVSPGHRHDIPLSNETARKAREAGNGNLVCSVRVSL